jgi:hypothetical protein
MKRRIGIINPHRDVWESAVEGDLAQDRRDRSGESYPHRTRREFEIATRRT